MPNINATLVQQIFHISKRKREPNIHHDSQTDDLRARLEVLEYVGFGHDWTLRNHPTLHKPVSSDTAQKGQGMHLKHGGNSALYD